MKHLLLVVALLLAGSFEAVAQSVLPATPTTSANATVTAVDSVALLHQLFNYSRHASALGVGLGISTGVSTGIIAFDSPYKAPRIIGFVFTGMNTWLLILTFINLVRFSRRREREAFEQLRQHQALRPYVQRQYALALRHASNPCR